MMPSTLGETHAAAYPPYTTDAILDDLSRHMAASQAARRLSRGSNGQRAGIAMRVVKPSSANNSPRSSIGRRRTLVNEGNLAKGEQVLDQIVLPHQAGAEYYVDPAKRASRPMSWHPASSNHIQQTQVPSHQLYGRTHPADHSRRNDHDAYTNYHQMSPMPPSCSCHTSPSTFSPLALPLNDFRSPSGLQQGGWPQSTQQAPSYVSPGTESNMGFPESFPSLSSGGTDESRSSGTADWNSFLLHGFHEMSPPTPENLPRMHEPKTAVAEEAIPYVPLEGREEEEGEILVGMGLYDTPDKFDADTSFGNYHRPTISSLLGEHRGQQSPGKGLKLEETWEPPQSEDEDDDDEDEEEE